MTFALRLVVLAVVFVAITCFQPLAAPTRRLSALQAHHVQAKAAKNKEKNRPRKHRPSDIVRAKLPYKAVTTDIENKPAEYTVVGGAAPASE
jgi:hypothetical protein